MKKLTEQQKVRRQILFNMPYLLLTFLIKEKVLDSFLDGSSKHAHDNKINLESFYTKLRDPYTAIECTFAWHCTEEGYDFWKRLNNKYKSILEMKDSARRYYYRVIGMLINIISNSSNNSICSK